MSENLFSRETRNGQEILSITPYALAGPVDRMMRRYEIQDRRRLSISTQLAGDSRTVAIASISDIEIEKPMIGRPFSCGTLVFRGVGLDKDSSFKWENVRNPEKVRTFILDLQDEIEKRNRASYENLGHDRFRSAPSASETGKAMEGDGISEKALARIRACDESEHQQVRSDQILIAASIEAVWSALTRVWEYDQWQPGSQMFEEPDAPLEYGAILKWQSWSMTGGQGDAVISVWEPLKRFAIERGRRDLFELFEEGDSVRVRMEMRTYHVPPSPSSGVKGLFSKPRNDKGMTQADFERVVAGGIETVRLVLKRLKARAERSVAEHELSDGSSDVYEKRGSEKVAAWTSRHEDALERLELTFPFSKDELADRYRKRVREIGSDELPQLTEDFNLMQRFAT